MYFSIWVLAILRNEDGGHDTQDVIHAVLGHLVESCLDLGELVEGNVADRFLEVFLRIL